LTESGFRQSFCSFVIADWRRRMDEKIDKLEEMEEKEMEQGNEEHEEQEG
jgi:hypothetical protein